MGEAVAIQVTEVDAPEGDVEQNVLTALAGTDDDGDNPYVFVVIKDLEDPDGFGIRIASNVSKATIRAILTRALQALPS